MSRPRSETGGPAAAASNRRRRALTYGDLPPEMKDAIQDYLRHTNESLRAAVKLYFEDKAACERRHGKIGTWDVGRVTDMSELFVIRLPSGGGSVMSTRLEADIGAWDTSSVTTMASMFKGCGAYTGQGIELCGSQRSAANSPRDGSTIFGNISWTRVERRPREVVLVVAHKASRRGTRRR